MGAEFWAPGPHRPFPALKYSVGILQQSMGARSRVGIRLWSRLPGWLAVCYDKLGSYSVPSPHRLFQISTTDLLTNMVRDNLKLYSTFLCMYSKYSIYDICTVQYTVQFAYCMCNAHTYPILLLKHCKGTPQNLCAVKCKSENTKVFSL